jgi:hypothetical protein
LTASALTPIRREFFTDANFPASTTITVHSLPTVGMMLEISAIAVVGDKQAGTRGLDRHLHALELAGS